MAEREFDYVVMQDSDGWYIALVPTLRDCYTATRNLEEIDGLVAEAVSLHLRCRFDSEPPPKLLDFRKVRL